ncbi:hypothetical protein [Rhizobium leguminosarum]|uniref:hypothetical protein n=1 Tax=Rhizobium leguminosarum TaxID=384 RepID=UPI001C8FF1EC|nr:hypothetical protein [Rhizobium leguminosarum]MBY3176794.1 hypothetical protein [Rhizobium leguminosarum]
MTAFARYTAVRKQSSANTTHPHFLCSSQEWREGGLRGSCRAFVSTKHRLFSDQLDFAPDNPGAYDKAQPIIIRISAQQLGEFRVEGRDTIAEFRRCEGVARMLSVIAADSTPNAG